MINIGIVDTTFARYDMYQDVVAVLEEYTTLIKYKRYTVPGIKDLPVGSLILFNRYNCDLVIALGMPGPKPVDKISAQVASQGIVNCQLKVGKHILEVFVHEDEGDNDDNKLKLIMQNRASSHARNAIDLLLYPERMTKRAGQGVRQGHKDAGPVKA